MAEGKELYWHSPSVTADDRRERYRYRSCAIWLTGLSASGKSTIANALSEKLHEMGIRSYVLDGDNVRHGLNSDLGFSPEDRKENIRRIAEVARLFVDAGLIVTTAFISPFREDRADARKLFRPGEFIEVFVKCPLPECERRDPKGVYQKARAGRIQEFTGISSPYEEPAKAELMLDTEKMSVAGCTEEIMRYLAEKGYFRSAESS